MIRILCVEDSESDTDLIRHDISKSPLAGYTIEVVDSIRSAVSMSAAKRPSIVLMDLDLRDKRGTEVFDDYHTVYPDVPIIIVSGSYTKTVHQQYIDLGAYDYVDKCDLGTTTRLYEAIERSLQRHKKKMDWQK